MSQVAFFSEFFLRISSRAEAPMTYVQTDPSWQGGSFVTHRPLCSLPVWDILMHQMVRLGTTIMELCKGVPVGDVFYFPNEQNRVLKKFYAVRG